MRFCGILVDQSGLLSVRVLARLQCSTQIQPAEQA